MDDIERQIPSLDQMYAKPQNTARPSPSYFSQFYYFTGNAMSLQTRLESMSDSLADEVVDATITVTGIEVKQPNATCAICTIIWAGILVFPLIFLCCDWWNRCVQAAYNIPEAVYRSLDKLLKGARIRNITLTVTDNYFGAEKAQLLFQMMERSTLKGFTFINAASPFDMENNNHSSFEEYMRPIRGIGHIVSDLRWNRRDC